MIRKLRIDEVEAANKLLFNFNYNLNTESFNNPFFNSLVYIDDGIKGIIIYNLLYDRVEIDYIIVDKNYRKKGIGSLLLKQVEKNKLNNITLEVRESNIDAINFYKKNGFEIVAIRKNYYGTENGYLMLKKLGE
jgi:ribosomal protein S18 acetylase RimI-like enzyme